MEADALADDINVMYSALDINESLNIKTYFVMNVELC